MARKLDVIIFGATGFTGKYTVFEATRVLKDLTWGIAGRNRAKLDEVLRDMGAKAKQDLRSIPTIIADVDNEASLLEMARQCRVIVNCCGPYRFFGEPVVRACIEAGTHQVDVTGEMQYMEKMQLKYSKQAEDANVYVVSACGFDSIPAEMGVVFAEQNFDGGVINSVENYVRTYRERGPPLPKSASLHFGTWESAIHAIANREEYVAIRRELFAKRLPKFLPRLEQHPTVHRSEFTKSYCLPFIGPDRTVVERSQRYLYERENKRPIQVHAYMPVGSWLNAMIGAMFGTVIGLMARFNFTRKLLLKYPKFFSFGMASHEGPSEAAMERARFAITIRALGWPTRLAEPTDKYPEPPTKSMTVRVTGPNPGYGATCVAVLSSALTILKESDKMPSTGGVIPPGAAFAKTSLISELEKHEHGIKFEVLEKSKVISKM